MGGAYAKLETIISTNGIVNIKKSSSETGYCESNGIKSFKECLIRNDSQQSLSEALNTINTRTSSLNLNNIEPIDGDVQNTEDTDNGTSQSNSGLYKGEDDYTVDADTYTYFYRGDVNNNWVKFGNYLWRVVRINGDGSIRLIYSGLASSSNHTGTSAQIKASTYGDTTSFKVTTTDITGLTNDTITTTYYNGRYGNTYVGYMYNPAKILSVYPNKTPSNASGSTLSSFPTFNNIANTTNYYFFKNFDPSTDCFTGSDEDESGACTLKCRSLGNDGDSGVDCVQSNWNKLATTSENYSTTDPGATSTEYVYKSDYKYTCWSYGTPVTKTNSDGTTSVYITCPLVSEVVGTVKDQPTQAKVKYHGLFSADADTSNKNVKDSKIKSEVDTWYVANILNSSDDVGNRLENYLADEIFCNDRSSTSTNFPLVNASSYLYGPYSRNTSSNRVPSFRCQNKGNDAFTLKTSGGVSSVSARGNGNNKLTYPVGLLTIDEAAYAGGRYGSMNYKYYLYTGSTYWTMSPSNFSSNNAYAYVWNVLSTGYLNATNSAAAYGVRPVVNLRSDILYSKGRGTETDPYVVALSD